MKKMLYPLLLVTIVGCVPQSDYNQLKSEKDELELKVGKLEDEISNIQHEYNQLLAEKRETEIEMSKAPYISEEKAILYIKDYYSFYEKDIQYRNIELRRIADNIFKVSVEECGWKSTSGEDPCDGGDFYWSAKVRTLTVYNNGKFVYSEK